MCMMRTVITQRRNKYGRVEDSKILETNWSETLFQQHWRTTDQDLAYDEGKTHILGGHTEEGWVCNEDCWCKGGSNETV